jgi:hypothetical protein
MSEGRRACGRGRDSHILKEEKIMEGRRDLARSLPLLRRHRPSGQAILLGVIYLVTNPRQLDLGCENGLWVEVGLGVDVGAEASQLIVDSSKVNLVVCKAGRHRGKLSNEFSVKMPIMKKQSTPSSC